MLALRKSQKNDVFRLLSSRGVDQKDFVWGERVAGILGNAPGASNYVPTLLRSGTNFHFSFDLRSEAYGVCYSPDRLKGTVRASVQSWAEVLELVGSWLDNLGVELEAPDLWSTLGHDVDAIVASAEPQQLLQPFTAEEKQALVLALESAQNYLGAEIKGLADGQKRIEDSVGHLEGALERQTKQDWLFMAVGVLASISSAMFLSAEQGRQAWHFILSVFKEIVGIGPGT